MSIEEGDTRGFENYRTLSTSTTH